MIRLATIADLEPLGYMVWALDWGHQQRGEAPILDALTVAVDHAFTTDQPVVVAEVDGRVVGLCLWVAMPQNQPGEATCFGTYVEPDHRRSGLSREMREFAESEHIKRGIHTFTGGVAIKGNTAGLESALAAGFEIVGALVRKKVGDGQVEQEREGRQGREWEELRTGQLLIHAELTDRGRL